MASPVETAAAVALMRIGRRPAQMYSELIVGAGSARRVFEEEFRNAQAPETLFDSQPPRRTEPDQVLGEAAAAIAKWREQGVEVVTVLDPRYPQSLRRLPDRPVLLFMDGEALPSDVRSVALVGSREPSTGGLALARTVAKDFVDAGFTPVSGLAAGIDTAVHESALASAGRTIAVLGSGIRRCYPPENAGLARRIACQGALISQFWPDSPPSRRSFPMRNAVMAGMTLGTVILEASHTSGTRIQARLALAQGRPVFVHRPLRAQAWARELLTRPGTHAFESSTEILRELDRLGIPGGPARDGDKRHVCRA